MGQAVAVKQGRQGSCQGKHQGNLEKRTEHTARPAFEITESFAQKTQEGLYYLLQPRIPLKDAVLARQGKEMIHHTFSLQTIMSNRSDFLSYNILAFDKS